MIVWSREGGTRDRGPLKHSRRPETQQEPVVESKFNVRRVTFQKRLKLVYRRGNRLQPASLIKDEGGTKEGTVCDESNFLAENF